MQGTDPGTANHHIRCLCQYLGKTQSHFTSEAKRKWKQLGASALCLGKSPTAFSWRDKNDGGDGTDPFDSQKPNLTIMTNIYVQKISMCRSVTKNHCIPQTPFY